MPKKRATRRRRGKKRRPRSTQEQMLERLEARVRELRGKIQARKRREAYQASKEPAGPRFSPKWLASHRAKLQLSAADYGELVGVTGQTIYNWEQGKAAPQRKQREALARVREMSRADAWAELGYE